MSLFTKVSTFLQALGPKHWSPAITSCRDDGRSLKSPADPNASRQCPKCGSPMVLRTIKSSQMAGQQYWECSTSPRCRVIQRIR